MSNIENISNYFFNNQSSKYITITNKGNNM